MPSLSLNIAFNPGISHKKENTKWVIRYEVPIGSKDGRNYIKVPLSSWASNYFDHFVHIREYVSWNNPERLFGFSERKAFEQELHALKRDAGYSSELSPPITADSFRVGDLCSRVLRNTLAGLTFDKACEKALHCGEHVAKDSIKRYLGTRVDRLKGEKRKFEELTMTELHPDIAVPVRGPFRKKWIAHYFKASDSFMHVLSSLYTAISGEGSSEKPPSPASYRNYCGKIGEKLFEDPSKIDPSMVALLDHLLETGKYKKGGMAKGLIVLCMASCGDLHAGNWRNAEVPQRMFDYLKRDVCP